MVAYGEVEGRRLASTLVQEEPSVTSCAVGSGTGDCDWHRAVLQARGTHVVFLRPGDRPARNIVGTCRAALTRHGAARWLVGTRPGASTDAWWRQPDLSESVAALLIVGVPFAEGTAVVQRTAWLDVAEVPVADEERCITRQCLDRAGLPSPASRDRGCRCECRGRLARG